MVSRLGGEICEKIRWFHAAQDVDAYFQACADVIANDWE